MSKRLTRDEFIKKAKDVHGNKDDFSEVVYANNKKDICLICKKHGKYYIRPCNYLNGSRCPICGHENTKVKNTSNYEDLIKKFRDVHGDKFHYYENTYVNSKTPMMIECPKHGIFYQTPNSHLSGRGCRLCGYENGHNKTKMTLDEFILKASKLFNGKYDYSQASLNDDLVKIICPIHGMFLKTVHNHLCGRGCPSCSESSLEREIESLLLSNNIEFERQKQFEWLGKQKLDFYLPKYNVGIECQGIQHFQSVKHFGGLPKFKIIAERDIKKYNACKDNNVKIFYFSNTFYKEMNGEKIYNDKQELINKILTLKNLES